MGRVAQNIEGKVAMIVGAGSGLGATLARRFAEGGADLVLAARSDASLDASKASVSASVAWVC
jgi:7-alpha-hydroxysteroid dehydrogenase